MLISNRKVLSQSSNNTIEHRKNIKSFLPVAKNRAERENKLNKIQGLNKQGNENILVGWSFDP